MRGPQLVYQPSVAQMQIAQAQGPMPRPAPPVVTTKTVHAPTVWRPQVTQVQQAYPYACDAAMRVSPAVSIVQPRKDVASQIRPAVAAEGHVATDAMNGKSWPVTYTRTTPWTGRVPTFAVPPEASARVPVRDLRRQRCRLQTAEVHVCYRDQSCFPLARLCPMEAQIRHLLLVLDPGLLD